MSVAIPISYVLPLRWEGDGGVQELAAYLRSISERAEVIVVDGSPARAFARHREAMSSLSSSIRHVFPDPDLRYTMGKVNGVITGVRRASHERVVIADDDIRYGRETLEAIAERLESAELVVPQNYFDPLPWHARWDTARTLLNRVATGDPCFRATDFPGTLAVRRSSFLEADAYDGNLIFENLELMRTIRATGGRVDLALDLFVRRLPPKTRHFLSQRVRQAYDDFAIPARMAGFLSLGPLVFVLSRRHPTAPLGLGLLATGLAEIGRRRAGGSAVYSAGASVFAVAWLAERAVCAWLALAQRFRGGIPYADQRISRSASSIRELERKLAVRGAGPPLSRAWSIRPTTTLGRRATGAPRRWGR